MLNFLNTTKPWILAALVGASSAFAQSASMSKSQKKCFNQGLEMPANQTMAAHNYPARTEVRGSWDVFPTASYIFWQPRQENMDIGIISNSKNPLANSSVSTIKHADFDYHSGFKVGLGTNLNYDHWDVYSEYTWLHGNSTTTVANLEEGTQLFPMQGLAPTNVPGTTDEFYFKSANQSWELKMDFADISLARSYYSGTKHIIRPYVGARGAWIRQFQATNYIGSPEAPTAGQLDLAIKQSTVSQGIGPRFGVNSNWMLGYGFRFIGNGSADILYTRYKYKIKEVATLDIAEIDITGVLSDRHNDFLRTHADVDLGFGWGSYLDNNNWFIDFSASYDFQVFWDQNMFRSYNGAVAYSNAPNGNLYVHGLTVTARLDF